MAVGARSMGAVGGNRGRRPIELKEEEVESEGGQERGFMVSRARAPRTLEGCLSRRQDQMEWAPGRTSSVWCSVHDSTVTSH